MEPVKEKERLKKSFMVMQDVNYQLFSDSVREEVLLGANRPELCEAVLEALGLTEFADRHPIRFVRRTKTTSGNCLCDAVRERTYCLR